MNEKSICPANVPCPLLPSGGWSGNGMGLKVRLSFLFFCFYISLGLHHPSFSQKTAWPFIRNYSPKEYAGVPQVYSVLQDKKTGIMYFGIEPGVMSYDGIRWEVIPTPNKTAARSLCQTEDGKIYVAQTDDFGYLSTDPRGKTVCRSLVGLVMDTTIKPGIVWSVESTGKEVFFQTRQHVFRYLPGKSKIDVFPSDSLDRFAGGFVHKGNYYVRISGKGMMKIENGRLGDAPHADYFKGKIAFREAVPYNENTMLIAGRVEGIHLYNTVSGEQPHAFHLQNQAFLTDNDIYCAAALPKNRFLLGSYKQGALMIDEHGNTLQSFNGGKLLQTDDIYDINYDQTGNLWLGLANGISKTGQGLDLGYWDKNAGLKGSVYAFSDSQNGLYAATEQMVYYFDEESRPQEVKGIPVGQNWALGEFMPQSLAQPAAGDRRAGSLLVGTSSGIYRIKGAEAHEIYKGSHAFVLLQSKLNPARLYSTDGTDVFMSLLYQNGKWIPEGGWVGIHDQIRAIAEAQDGALWLGTGSNGIIKVVPNFAEANSFDKVDLNPKSIKYYTEKDGLPSLNNNKPFWFKGQIVWGTDKGLYVHNPKTDRFESFCGLGHRFCDGGREVRFFQEMQNGKIYISSGSNKKQDIGYLKPDGRGGYDWVYKPFRFLPEIAAIETMFAEENGLLWIGGSEGLFRYDENEDNKEYGMLFNCWVREVRGPKDSIVFYGGGATDPALQVLQASPNFKYRENTLKFLFAAPFFDSEERTLYSHKLEGFDEDWSVWDRHTEKEYTGLWEGDYTFLVKAKNIYDVESYTDSYAFTVLPPWYRSWWAYTSYLLLAGLILFGTAKVHSRRLEADKKRLEELVKQRTLEIVGKNKDLEASYQEIQLQNEEIQQQNEEIQQQTEEIAAQRDVLMSAYENIRLMSDIGKEITRHISVEQIIDIVYSEVNKLMPADGFGIGVYNEMQNRIDFPGYIEKGIKLPFFWDELTDGDSFSDWCFRHQKEVVVGEIEHEYDGFLSKLPLPMGGAKELAVSLIYLPLILQGKALGNITVQSFRKNAYNENHLNLFRNIALYTAIALDNAAAYEKLDLEKEKSDKLLLNILPKETADELKEKGRASTKYYEKVTVLFTDFFRFTQITEKMHPEEVVENLNYCFTAFDRICKKYGIEKIKTIGDSYMCAAGIPVADDDNPERMVEAALEMLAFMNAWKAEKAAQGVAVWELRIGIHTGPVVAGVVGEDKFAYDIWGDTVNTASRMESSGKPSMINISEATYLLVKEFFRCSFRGEVQAKNKGMMGMYFVNS